MPDALEELALTARERGSTYRSVERNRAGDQAILIVITLLIVASIIGGTVFLMTRANRPGSQPATTPPVDLVVTSSQLVKDYTANEVAADHTYRGKRVRVTGKVRTISRDMLNDLPFIVLDSSDLFRGVQITFNKEQERYVASLRKGDEVTLEGTCAGLLVHVQIR